MFDWLRSIIAAAEPKPESIVAKFSASLNTDAASAHQGHGLSSYPLVYVRQEQTWDCGIACLLMVWSWIFMNANQGSRPNRVALDGQRTRLLQAIDTQSIWTIDLAFILFDMINKVTPQDYDITKNAINNSQQQHQGPIYECVVYSNMLEPNDEWKDFPFYAGTFEEDQIRTRQRLHHLLQQFHHRQQLYQKDEERFSLAASIRLEHISPGQSLDWILQQMVESPQRQHVNHHHNQSFVNHNLLAILLVDCAMLRQLHHHQQQQQQPPSKESLLDQEPCSSNGSICVPYAGHYLLLVDVIGNPLFHDRTAHTTVSLQETTSTTTATPTGTADTTAAPSNVPSDCRSRLFDKYQEVIVYDPNLGVTRLPPHLLEQAWQASGTDQDVILIRRRQRQQ